MALCKADLVAAVLKQLGHPVPDASRLTEAVMSASTDLKKQAGLDVKACLLMTPVDASAYQGGIRDQTRFAGGVKV